MQLSTFGSGRKTAVLVFAWCIAGACLSRGADEGPRALEALRSGEDFYVTDPQLEGLIDDLLATNPRILAAHATWESARERVSQAAPLPDLDLRYRYYVETPETRVGPQVQSVEITQEVPWFGQRKLMGGRATHEAAGVAWRARDLERSLVAELKRAFFDIAYLREALEVNAEEASLLRRFERSALTRYSTGEGIQQTVIKVQTDVSRLIDQQTSLREQVDVATVRIAELVGRSGEVLHLRPVPLVLPEDHGAHVAVAGDFKDHPSLKMSQERLAADRDWLDREKLSSRPAFRFGVGYVDVGRREDTVGRLVPPEDNGKDSWSLNVGIGIPIQRKRNRAGVREAESRIRSRERTLESIRNSLESAVRRSVLRLHSADERARIYRDVIIPQAEESLASAEAAYTTNRQGFLDMVDAERVLFKSRLSYHRLVADYWIALADLEHSLGRRFPAQGARS
jgi:outer membrane protein TolC